MALSCAVNTIETNFYDIYSNTVNSVISSILSNMDIETIVEKQLTEKENKENNQQAPVNNTSSDNAVIIQNNNGQSETLKTNLSYLVYETTNKLYNIYESVKVSSNKEPFDIGILFFILFGILVVRIKDTIAEILKNKIIARKPIWLLS